MPTSLPMGNASRSITAQPRVTEKPNLHSSKIPITNRLVSVDIIIISNCEVPILKAVDL